MPITIFSPLGEATEYRKVSERLPEFLKMFPLTDGYRVIRSHQSDSEYSSSLHALWTEALKAGKKPGDIGLPHIYGMSVIFEASLFHNETLIANASAYKHVSSPKDWEAGETASFQRLMAACGLGGTDMDCDDQYDRISSGLERSPKSSSSHHQTARNDTPATVVTSESTVSESQANVQEPKTQPNVSETAAQVDESLSGKPQETIRLIKKVNPENHDGIRPQLLNQLNHAASLAGEPVPQVSDNAEAKKEIKRLTRKAQGK